MHHTSKKALHAPNWTAKKRPQPKMSVHTMKQLRQYSSTLPPEKKTPPKRQLRGEEQLCVPQPPSLSRPKNTTTKKDNYVCYLQQSFQSKKEQNAKKGNKKGQLCLPPPQTKSFKALFLSFPENTGSLAKPSNIPLGKQSLSKPFLAAKRWF